MWVCGEGMKDVGTCSCYVGCSTVFVCVLLLSKHLWSKSCFQFVVCVIPLPVFVWSTSLGWKHFGAGWLWISSFVMNVSWNPLIKKQVLNFWLHKDCTVLCWIQVHSRVMNSSQLTTSLNQYSGNVDDIDMIMPLCISGWALSSWELVPTLCFLKNSTLAFFFS